MLSGIFRVVYFVLGIERIQCWMNAENGDTGCGSGGRISLIGSSHSSESSRSSTLRLFKIFTDARQLNELHCMSAKQFCTVDMLQAFSHFLVHDYKQQNGSFLALNTVHSTLSEIMIIAREKFRSADGTFIPFFNVLGAKQDAPTNWYRDLRKSVERIIQRRCIEKGDPIIDQSTPISRQAIIEASWALLCMGKPGNYNRFSVL